MTTPPATPLVSERYDDGVAYLMLCRPEKLNCLIEPMRQALASAIERLHTRTEVRACVIAGHGRGFCAGGDIDVMQRIIREESYDELQSFLAWGKSIVQGLRTLPIPVIAAINGPAAGAGMNLALACDYRIASDDATFGQTFIKIGLHPDWGGTYFVPRIAGPSRALELFWSGRVFGAKEALAYGLVDEVVPAVELNKRVAAFVRMLKAHSREAIAQTKLGVYAGLHGDLESVLTHEAVAQDRCIRSPEAREGIQRFVAQRKAVQS